MTRFPAIFLLFILMLILAAAPHMLRSQEKTKISYAGKSWQYNKAIWADGPRLIGEVLIRHDSATLWCDSARINEAGNWVMAFGNVHIRFSDTLNLWCDSLRYDGNIRIANAFSNVKLVDNQTVLTTDRLVFDRNTRIATYDTWGKIVNGDNVLVSRYGYYYTDRKEFFFRHKVTFTNPDHKMRSDTLMYNTVTETAYFFGPSDIISTDGRDSIYCENGWYDTRAEKARFRENAKIYRENTMLRGDSMYYERRGGFGQVFRNAVILDTVQNILMTGHYGELRRKAGFAFMTDSAVAVLTERGDSLFMHADTVMAHFAGDSIRFVDGFHRVKFWRRDIQGMCDSLRMRVQDSTMTMYREPVLWSDSNQLSADSIVLTMCNGMADSLKLYNSAFIISRDDSASFNQVKGRNVLAKFRDNKLYKINVSGNAQTIYYGREEDRTLIGINVAVASDMLMFLDNNKISSITFIERPQAQMYPEKDLPPNERLLRDFKWLETRRPMSRDDIFRW